MSLTRDELERVADQTILFVLQNGSQLDPDVAIRSAGWTRAADGHDVLLKFDLRILREVRTRRIEVIVSIRRAERALRDRCVEASMMAATLPKAIWEECVHEELYELENISDDMFVALKSWGPLD